MYSLNVQELVELNKIFQFLLLQSYLYKSSYSKMALMTMVARVVDGLPLVGTMQDDEQV